MVRKTCIPVFESGHRLHRGQIAIGQSVFFLFVLADHMLQCMKFFFTGVWKMKKILVITTGGTIAMKKDRETGGLMPAVSGKDLAAAVPGLAHYADLDVLEFSNKPSGWMTAADMFELSKLIDRLADTDQADGFVITHGTDTLEETAFFLEAVL